MSIQNGSTVYVVDKLDNGYKLCKGRVIDLNHHVGTTALVEWQDPKRDPSFRSERALSTNPVVALVSRNDLPIKTLQAVEEDAKLRGLLEQ